MANVVEFTHTLQGTDFRPASTVDASSNGASVDFAVELRPPLTMRDGGNHVVIQTLELELPSPALNIFDGRPYGYEFDNRFVVIQLDWHPRIAIRLPSGTYLLAFEIAAAINAAIGENLHWWLNNDDPGFKIQTNVETRRLVFTLDDGKLDPAMGVSVMIDFRYIAYKSDLYALLGFNSGDATISDNGYLRSLPGEIEAPNRPNFNPQGTSINVCCSLAPLRRINSTDMPLLASVPYNIITTAYSGISTSWPTQGKRSPKMYVTLSPKIYNYHVWVVTGENRPMVFSGGSILGKIGFFNG